jgi:hypothetical protein
MGRTREQNQKLGAELADFFLRELEAAKKVGEAPPLFAEVEAALKKRPLQQEELSRLHMTARAGRTQAGRDNLEAGNSRDSKAPRQLWKEDGPAAHRFYMYALLARAAFVPRMAIIGRAWTWGIGPFLNETAEYIAAIHKTPVAEVRDRLPQDPAKTKKKAKSSDPKNY